MARPVSPALAFAVVSLGVGMFACMDAAMKGLSLALGAYAAMMWRSFAGLVMVGPVWLMSRPGPPAAGVMRLHVARALVTAVMALLFFWGLVRVPIAQAVSLAFISPVIALFLAGMFLKERIGRGTVFASLVAFAGVLVILLGQATGDMGPDAFRGALAVLASAVCYAVNIILMRAQSQRAGPLEVAFFQSLFVSLALGLPALLFPLAGAWPATHLPAILLAALLATVSLGLMSWGYGHADASYLSATEYTAFLWSATLGWLVFGERVSPFTFAGAALIVGGCLWVARHGSVPAVGPEAPL